MNLKQVCAWIASGEREALAQWARDRKDSVLTDAEKQIIVRTAARNGQSDILRDMFTLYHLSATDADETGRTLLHEAASSGDPETIAFVMDVIGFDPLLGDQNGVTPLDEAAGAKKTDGYRMLTQRLGFGVKECYRNPIIRGFHPDPSVVRVGEDYYLVNSSFVLFPGVPVFHSRDLVHWRQIGHAVENLAASGLEGLPGGFGYWAPDISYSDGKFWVVATLRRNTPPYRLQMMTTAVDPRGPWTEPVFIPLDGIDPSLFVEDGHRYMLLNPGAILTEISDTGDILSAPQMLYYGSAKIKPEGPHLLKKDGWYYLFLAEGGTGDAHRETVVRSRCLKGPYEECPYNPILGQKVPWSSIQRSGHGKLVSTPDGRWYMIYLCGRKVEGRTMLGRETALDPVTWTADGWPIVNSGKGPSCLQRMPYVTTSVPDENGEDWIAPRTDPASFVSANGEKTILQCGSDPADRGPCSLLLCRQREAGFVQSVHISMENVGEGSFGGMAGYYDERSFFLYTARREEGHLILELTEQIGNERKTQQLTCLEGYEVTLRIKGTGLTRVMEYVTDGKDRQAGQVYADYLSDEGLQEGKRFTGALLGLAAIGKGQVCFTAHTVSWQVMH